MTKTIETQQRICDGCGATDTGSHMAAGHFNTGWSTQRGYDLCHLCETILKAKLFEKANVDDIEMILATIDNSGIGTFGTFRPLNTEAFNVYTNTTGSE